MLASVHLEPPPQHQVFINFRGQQLRYGFVSHLVRALRWAGINVFIDEEEVKGEDLNIFFERIEESKIALAIFSSQYTESKWCLDELEKIKECVDLGKLVAIPIFYKIETDDVNKLEGEFGDKFWELAKTCKGEKIDKWREALEAVTDKIGIRVDNTSNESQWVDNIVKKVMEVLTKISTDREREIPIDKPCPVEKEALKAAADSSPTLLGMETRLKQLEEKSNFKCKGGTLTIGIVGMPGIGKTTLMKEFYEKHRHEFLRYAFIPDVYKMWKCYMMNHNIFMKELLKDENVNQEVADMSPDSLKARLLNNTSLIVLDNVSDKRQIKELLGECDWVKQGSRIYITTRDRSVIEGFVDDTYEVSRLTGRDSFLCFEKFAFGDKLCIPKENFTNLSRLFVDYAKGNPLALSILGAEVNGKDETHWKEKLGKLRESPNKTIQNVLQISYDGLCDLQKDVFLDVACFFISEDEYYVRCLVESCDSGVSKIRELTSKFFINVSGGRVEMHDLLYTFGKELGLKGSHRLLNHKDVVKALRNPTGGRSVRGIFLDMTELKHILSLDKSTFVEMRNLRYLKFYSSRYHRECETDCKLNFPKEPESWECKCKIHFPDGFEFPLDELRYLYWLNFPLKKLPQDFKPKNLIDLNMPYSEIEEVWEGIKDIPNLKWVDLSHSSKLCNLSGLQNAKSLQRLNLEGCTSLHELPKQMKNMESLIFLNMRGCDNLSVLPRMNMISLRTLILSNCSKLRKFQVISDNLENLQLDGTAIAELPSDMVKLQRLIVLNLKDCKKLREVPENLGKLKALQELVLSDCFLVKSFPIPLENMKCLHILLLDGTAITDIPKMLRFNTSKVEDLPDLRRGMSLLSSLRRLCLSRNVISNFEIDISQLYHLKRLDLKYCKNLTSIPLLPPNLEILDAHRCSKLKTVASPMALLKPVEQVHSKFIFTYCNSLEQAAKNSITSYAQRRSQLSALRCYEEGNVSEALLTTSFPGSEVPSWFNHRTIGSVLKLKFAPHWCENRLSTIVLCAVVAFPSTQDKTSRFSIECTCEFKNGTETSSRFNCNLGGGWIEPRRIDSSDESDHVFIGYISSSHLTKHLEESLQSQDNTDVIIEFKVIDGEGEIMNCGLSLVYEEPKHVAVEGNYAGITSRSHVSVRNTTLSFAAGFFCLLFLVYGFCRVFSK